MSSGRSPVIHVGTGGGGSGPGGGGVIAYAGAIIEATDPQTFAANGNTGDSGEILLPTVVEDSQSGDCTGTANNLTFPFAGTWDVFLTVGIKKASGDDTPTSGVFSINLTLPDSLRLEHNIRWEELDGGSSYTGRSLVWSGHADEGDQAAGFATNYIDVPINVVSRDSEDRGAMLSIRLRVLPDTGS